jgi:hypothetical protein
MKKKITAYVAAALFPFICVWVAFIATGFMFNPHDIFMSDVFMFFCVLYYMIVIWPVLYTINESRW